MKAPVKKPRICIALPGINYLPHSPYVLSTLPMVPYLEQNFEVTLVYRKIVDGQEPDHPYLTILDPNQLSAKERQNQHGYFAPQHYLSWWKYQRALDQFAEDHAQAFDLVIEKEWPFLGSFASAFRRQGVPVAIIAEAEYQFQKKNQPLRLQDWVKAAPRKMLGLGLERLRPHWRKQWIQSAESIVVETEQMKAFLLERGYQRPATAIHPIPYGIDLNIFYPRDRGLCRQQLGLDQRAVVLTYVGSLNRFIQEPAPLIEALGQEKPPGVVLHIVGDGAKRHELEAIAKAHQAAVVFHGRLPQEQAALYVGASDLCLAPYDKSLYPDQRFTCASLKVPEYLACGRSVLTIPCERMQYLLADGRYGWLVENQVYAYREFFRNFPTAEQRLDRESAILTDLENSTLKEREIVLTWQDIANMYKRVILKALSGSPSSQGFLPTVTQPLVTNR